MERAARGVVLALLFQREPREPMISTRSTRDSRLSMKDSGNFAIGLGCHQSRRNARLFRGEGVLHQAGNHAHVGAAGQLRFQRGNHLAHGLRAFGAGVEYGLRHQSLHFFAAQRLRHVGLDDAGFEFLDFGQIIAAGGFELADGVLALLEHFFQDGQHDLVGDLDALVHFALFQRGEHETDDAQAFFVAGFHGGLHIVGQLRFQGHTVSGFSDGINTKSRIRAGATGFWTRAQALSGRSIQALTLGDVARTAAHLTLDGGGGFAFAFLRRLFVEFFLAGIGQNAGFFAGALEATQGEFKRFVFADFYIRHGNSRTLKSSRPSFLLESRL